MHLRGAMAKKPPRSSLKWYFLLLGNYLKFEILGTTNETQMNLRPDMHLLNTFHIPKNEDINEWVGKKRIQKITTERHKITLRTQIFAVRNFREIKFQD